MPTSRVKPMSLQELEAQVEALADVDALSLLAYNDLTRTTRAVNAEIDRRSGDDGLSVGRNAVLWCLSRAEDRETGLMPAEIADNLEVTRTTVTGILNALEAEGLVTRERSSQDRRRVHVRLTDTARRAIAVAWPRQSRTISRIMGELSDREKRQLTAILAKIRRGLAARESD